MSKKQFRIGLHLNGVPGTKHFINRPRQLQELQQGLSPGSWDSARKISTIRGVGGVGKTELARQFALQHQSEYTSVFWIDGSTEESIQHGLAGLFGLIFQHLTSDETTLLERKATTLEVAVGKVLEWFALEANHEWLLIIDNLKLFEHVEDECIKLFDLESYLPNGNNGHILITTRESEIGMLGLAVELAGLDLGQSFALFAERERMFDAGEPEVAGEASLIEDKEHIERLLVLLNGHPIAIAQAKAFIQQTNTSISSYLAQYESEMRALKASSIAISSENLQQSVLVTSAISYRHIKCEAETAANFLAFWSYLDHAYLSFQLFTPDFPLPVQREALSWFCSAIEEEQNFIHAMHTLQAYSMIRTKKDSSVYCIDRVIHECISQNLTEQRRAEFAWLAVRTMGRATSLGPPLEEISLDPNLYSHADCCYELVMAKVPDPYFTLNSPLLDQSVRYDRYLVYLSAIHRLGKHFRDRSKMNEASNLMQRTCEGYQMILGADNGVTLNALDDLAEILAYQGKIDAAEATYLHVLEGYKRTLGDTAPLTLETAETLSTLYHAQEKFGCVADMLRLVLNGQESVRGPKDPKTLHTAFKLGVLLSMQDDLDEAVELHLRTLAVRRTATGTQLLLNSMNNIVRAYLSKGRFTDAEKWSMVIIDEAMVTPDADVRKYLKTASAVATACHQEGRWSEAEKVYTSLLERYERLPGSYQEDLLDITYNLSTVLFFQNKFKAAERMLLRSKEGYERTRGPDHPYTLDAISNLAAVNARQGRSHDAEVLHLQCVDRRKAALGLSHPSTLDSMNNIGNFYSNQEKLKEAEDMYLCALNEYTQLEHPLNPSAFAILINLGRLYTKQGMRHESEKMYTQALDGYQAALAEAPGSACTASAGQNDLSLPVHVDPDEHVAYIQPMADGHVDKSNLEQGYRFALDALPDLIDLHIEYEEFIEAENLYFRLLIGQQQLFGLDHHSTTKILGDLAVLVFRRSQQEHGCNAVDDSTAHDLSQNKVGFFSTANPTFRLAWLAKDYCRILPAILSFLGRELLNQTDDQNARTAMQYGLALSMESLCQAAVVCDLCKASILPSTGCYVCKTCPDTDVCAGCFDSWHAGQWVLESCLGHDFFDVYDTREWPMQDVQIDVIRSWIQGIIDLYRTKCAA